MRTEEQVFAELERARERLSKAEADLKKYQNEPAPDEVREWLVARKVLAALESESRNLGASS